jgi:hypothetical protein
LVEHSLGKGEVISSILIIGSRIENRLREAALVAGVMTGPWLIVKWMGIAVLVSYMALLLLAIWKVRGRFGRLRFGLFVPLVLGEFIGLSLPGIFEKAAVTRMCFVVAHLIYLLGMVILVKAIVRDGGTGLRADG